jgi:hypothetical protein
MAFSLVRPVEPTATHGRPLVVDFPLDAKCRRAVRIASLSQIIYVGAQTGMIRKTLNSLCVFGGNRQVR